MMRFIILSSMFVVVLCFSNGCMIRHGDFTVLSNKLVNVSNFEIDKSDRIKGSIGKDTQHTIMFFVIGGQPTLEGALDDAFGRGGGDVMTDAVVKEWWFYIPLIYGQHVWQVKGELVKTRNR